jgi:hypothetical protein
MKNKFIILERIYLRANCQVYVDNIIFGSTTQ